MAVPMRLSIRLTASAGGRHITVLSPVWRTRAPDTVILNIR